MHRLGASKDRGRGRAAWPLPLVQPGRAVRAAGASGWRAAVRQVKRYVQNYGPLQSRGRGTARSGKQFWAVWGSHRRADVAILPRYQKLQLRDSLCGQSALSTGLEFSSCGRRSAILYLVTIIKLGGLQRVCCLSGPRGRHSTSKHTPNLAALKRMACLQSGSQSTRPARSRPSGIG